MGHSWERAAWARRGRWSIAITLSILIGSLASNTTADHVFWETGELLTDFFPDANRVVYERVELNASDLRQIEEATGRPVGRTEWIIFISQDLAGEVTGYAIFDEEPGQHQPITFAVQFDANGFVQRQEVVIYREPFGDQIRSPRFRAQFVGRGPGDAMRDIAAVTGATISSESMRVGVRRCVEVLARLLRTRPNELLAQVDLDR